VRRYRVVIFTDRAMTPDECKVAREECGRLIRVEVDPATGAASNVFFLPVKLQGGTFSAVAVEGEAVSVGELLATAEANKMALKQRRLRNSAPAPDTNNGGGGDSVGETGDEAHTDEEIRGLLRTRNKRGRITRLFEGKLDDHGGDPSAADLALASEIAFYTRDHEQVERLFSQSKLAERAKWKEREDYRARTISKAIDDAPGYYWDGAGGTHKQPAKTLKDAEGKLTGGVGGLTLGARGKLAPNIGNAIQLLLRDHRTQGAMGFNQFSGAPEVLRPLREVFGPSASEALGEFREADVTPIRTWWIREWGIDPGKNDALDAVVDWAKHCAFNPVTAALGQCAAGWDSVRRLDSWLSTYLGVAEGEDYSREVGRRWMISAVARAFVPGCKVDHVLVLEGAQGAGKSLAARTLAEAVYPAGFVDSIPVLSDRHETARSLRGTWIAELAELTSFRKAEAEHIKAFITTQADRIRDPYERRFANWPRTCVFVGTTNQAEYNADDTGGRRLWSVIVGKIDIEALRRDAAQLWGEAVHAYRTGEPWHLTGTAAVKQAAEHQRDRQISDVWDEALTALAAKLAADRAAGPVWSLGDLFKLAFQGEDLDMRPQPDQKRFAGSLRRAGFENKKTCGLMRWRVKEGVLRVHRGGTP
jgi:predicted P-loop ATPase